MGKVTFFISAIFMFGVVALGQEPFPMPDVDPLAQLLLLVRDWKAMGPLALGMGFVILVVQLVKAFAPGFKYSRVAVTTLSVVYAVLMAASTGSTWLEALIAVVVVGGGAVAIYEAFKGASKTAAKVASKVSARS